MKGFVIEIALIGMIFTVGTIMLILMPLMFTKIHLVGVVEYTYNYNNAHLALLSVLSVTSADTLDRKIKPAYEIIGEYVSLPSGARPDLGFVKDALDKMASNGVMKCYTLSSPSVDVIATDADSSCTPSDKTATAKIPIISNGQTSTEELRLVIS
jgi:hypothetical protein